jgi:hypothetical protein
MNRFCERLERLAGPSGEKAGRSTASAGVYVPVAPVVLVPVNAGVYIPGGRGPVS